MPGLRQHGVIRAANYLSVTVMDRIDQPALRSVQVGSGGELRCCSLAGKGLGLELKPETWERKSVAFNPFRQWEGEASCCVP